MGTQSGMSRRRIRAAAVIGGLAVITAGSLIGTGSAAAAGREVTPSLTVDHPAAAPAADWPTYDRTAALSGVSTSTHKVTTAKAVKRGWIAHLDGAVYGQPLIVGSEVVVGTENDSVYGLAKDSGRVLWRRHLGTPVTGGLACAGDIKPSGITGTPVADVATNRLYVVSFSPYHHTLWTLNLSNGRVVHLRPIDGPSGGSHPFNVTAEQQRSALAIDGDRVYVAFGGLDGDCGPYHGWVIASGLRGRGGLVDYETPTQREAGIWSPPGPAVGPDGIYVATGNGTPVNVVDDSDSVLRLSPTTLKVASSFTPSDYVKLSSDDLDLGTTSPVVLPHHQVFMIGKEGVGYLLRAEHLGGLGHPLAQLQVCDGGFGGDVVVGETVIMSCFDGLYAVRVTPGSGQSKPALHLAWSYGNISPGPPIVAGGIVWDVTRGEQLVGVRVSSGAGWYETGTSTVLTSFPSLSASDSRLFVPEGTEVVSYRGI